MSDTRSRGVRPAILYIRGRNVWQRASAVVVFEAV